MKHLRFIGGGGKLLGANFSVLGGATIAPLAPPSSTTACTVGSVTILGDDSDHSDQLPPITMCLSSTQQYLLFSEQLPPNHRA